MKKFLCLCACLLLVGCQTKPSNGATNDKESREVVKNVSYAVKEASLELRKKPDQGVLNQVTWTNSDKKEVTPSKKDILFYVTYNNESTTVAKVPDVSIPTYYVFQQVPDEEGQEKGWRVKGVMDAVVDKSDSFKEESSQLKLPMQDYVAGNFKDEKNKQKVMWVFAGEKQVVLIQKYPYSVQVKPDNQVKNSPLPKLPVGNFDPADPNKPEDLKDRDFKYFQGAYKQSILYYKDNGNLVWISGNISESEIKKLAESLPTAKSPNFPLK
ncbi:DUF4367 domain-containing protein [Thermoactinomyces sp. DSM 45892]|uniref:DUF4367 domain-containing protein n=1 Tax=Thermoactinomyces sp. DSM 45892 TaxID=1882753 RepID=UPI0008968045|nr:DUF4367 domain-containing protein [Thermoactinomyces sp. DSM 45892]SDY69922.1 hypothetical protein SAMN05444416_107110 [Thermoactinomyces sp. DSM 45892]